MYILCLGEESVCLICCLVLCVHFKQNNEDWFSLSLQRKLKPPLYTFLLMRFTSGYFDSETISAWSTWSLTFTIKYQCANFPRSPYQIDFSSSSAVNALFICSYSIFLFIDTSMSDQFISSQFFPFRCVSVFVIFFVFYAVNLWMNNRSITYF